MLRCIQEIASAATREACWNVDTLQWELHDFIPCSFLPSDSEPTDWARTMSTPAHFQCEPVSPMNRSPPLPPQYLKRQIYSDPAVFKPIDQHAINVSTDMRPFCMRLEYWFPSKYSLSPLPTFVVELGSSANNKCSSAGTSAFLSVFVIWIIAS